MLFRSFKIEAKGNEEQDGGSRIVPPGIYNWDELQFKDIIQMAGLSLPPADNPFIDYSISATAKAKPTASGLIKPAAKAGVKLKL